MNILNSTRTAFLHGFRAVIFQAANKLTVSTGSCKPCFSNPSLPWHPHVPMLVLQKPPAPPTDPGLRSQKPNSHLKLFYVVIISPPQSSQFPHPPALEPQGLPTPSVVSHALDPRPVHAPIHSLPSPTSYSHLSPVTPSPTSCSPSLERSLTEADYKPE